MKIIGTRLTMESTQEALDVFLRPQCVDLIGGGRSSVEYAVYDYCGIDLKGKPSEYVLVGETPAIGNFYNKLCKNSRLYDAEERDFDMVSGEHSFDEDSQVLRILNAYKENESNFELEHVASGDDLYMAMKNLKNDRVFKFSVASDDYEHHSAYWILYNQWAQITSEKKTVQNQLDVDYFLSDM